MLCTDPGCFGFWNDYTIQVQLNDYLDIMCPHYEDERLAGTTVERYTLFLVNHEEYVACKPVSKSQVRWECNNPFNLNGPEKFREKFQKFTAFSPGKEFKEGHSYYYISKPIHHHGDSCLKLKVQVIGKATQQPMTNVHTPGARAVADDPAVALPEVQKSVAHNSAESSVRLALLGLLLPLLLSLGL
ncbi:ephrin-A1 isoform X2 [Dendropsophus ebraccatus]|uniref:ephrin-A1 isoform X2 n=1 Tax=Dendropsophus ebraccatus TaxID=150705 RepID=UPI003832006D